MIISCAYRAGAYQDCSLEGGGGGLYKPFYLVLIVSTLLSMIIIFLWTRLVISDMNSVCTRRFAKVIGISCIPVEIRI